MYTCYCCNNVFTGVANRTNNMCPPCAQVNLQEKILKSQSNTELLSKEKDKKNDSNPEVGLIAPLLLLLGGFFTNKWYRWAVIISTICLSYYNWDSKYPISTIILWFVHSLIVVGIYGVIGVILLVLLPVEKFLDNIVLFFKNIKSDFKISSKKSLAILFCYYSFAFLSPFILTMEFDIYLIVLGIFFMFLFSLVHIMYLILRKNFKS